jgi:hypothetical protein
MAVVVNTPPVVVPEVAPKVTLPPSVLDWLKVTAAPETKLPPASFAVTVRGVEVGGVEAEIDDLSAFTVMVEPTICTGIEAGGAVPAVAVTVAVRLALFPPQERITVPGVVIVGALRTPVSVDIVTTTPDNAAFKAFNALTVIVDVVEPSDFICGGEAEISREAAVVPAEVPVLVMIMAFVEPVMLACTISCTVAAVRDPAV